MSAALVSFGIVTVIHLSRGKLERLVRHRIKKAEEAVEGAKKKMDDANDAAAAEMKSVLQAFEDVDLHKIGESELVYLSICVQVYVFKSMCSSLCVQVYVLMNTYSRICV